VAQADKTKVFSSMAAPAAPAVPGNIAVSARMEMQQWQNFPYYMRKEQWDVLRSEERQLNKIKILGQMLVTMGLRCPSERTYCMVCALLCHTASQEQHRMIEEDVNRATALLTTVKSTLKTLITRARQLGTPLLDGQYVVELPSNPNDLPGLMFQQIFATSPPVAPPMDINTIWRSANAWACRSTNLRHRQQEISPPLLGSVNAMQLAQHSAMVASTVLAMTSGQARVDLPGFQMLPTSSERRPTALRQMMDRADGSVPDVASSRPVSAAALAPATSVPLLALENGSLESVPPGHAAAAVEPAVPAVPAQVTALAHAVAQEQNHANAEERSGETVETQDNPQEGLNEVLSALAKAHYDKDLSDPKDQQEILKKPSASVKQLDADAKKAGMKRPAAAPCAMKRPASGLPFGEIKTSMKRPSAKSAKETAEKKKKMVAKKTKAAVVPKRAINRKQAAKERPHGCSKCRRQKGCTPSCWKGRNVKLVD
jgi:hypothetical protein